VRETWARAVSRAPGDAAEGELGEVPPEAAPAAREQAGVGGGAGATEADEDLEEEVVGKAADVVHAVSVAALAGPRPAGAARSEGWLRTEGETGAQLHET